MPTLVLEQLAHIDHEQHEALGAFDRHGLVASAHWSRPDGDPDRAEIVMQVIDRYQRRGVGTRLLRAMGDRARRRDIAALGATVPAEHVGAFGLFYATGWSLATRSCGTHLSLTATI